MADEPENLTIRLLQEMRSDMREGFEKAFGDLAELRKDMSEMQHEVAAMRVDQRRTNETLEHHSEILEKLAETQANQGARINAIDGRLALIEKHTGMVKA
jgi:chromosome segregation ATPase